MASRAPDWIGAAWCCEGPRPTATFADLPRAHQREILCLAIIATLSASYVLALGAPARPIPSRSLIARVTLPNVAVARAALLDVRQLTPIDAPSPRPLRARPVRQPAAVQLVSLRESAVDDRPTESARTPPERRRNVFSRIFHGVVR
jgi:hypothetical protein